MSSTYRRRKLVAGLLDQIKLIDAIEQGETHTKTKMRKQIAQGTNEVVTTSESRSVSPWWTNDDDGTIPDLLPDEAHAAGRRVLSES